MKTDWSLFLQDGLIISLVGVVIVFSALLFLYKAFTWISLLISFNVRKRLKREGKLTGSESPSLMIPADEGAAIAMALYLYTELHDRESNVITIDRTSKLYSPWCSKYYNMRKSLR